MSNSKPVLLIVDDNQEMGDFATFAGEISGYEVVCVSSGRGFQEAFLLVSPDLVLMDLAIPDIDGIGLLDWLGDYGSHVQIILMSGHGDYMLNWAKSVGEDLGISIIGFFKKPISLDDLEKTLSDTKAMLVK